MLALVVLALCPVVLLALFGLFRIHRLQDVLEPDGHVLAEFAAALRAFAQSAGHDARALAALDALAPDVAPLLLGVRRPAPRAVPSGIEPFPVRGVRAAESPPDRLDPERLLGDLAGLAHAFDDVSAGPRAADERARLEDLRGQILGAERLLEAERERLGRAEASLVGWLAEGAAGLALAAVGRPGDERLSARTRRRLLEVHPRFQRVVRAAVIAGAIVALGFVLYGARRALTELLRRAGS